MTPEERKVLSERATKVIKDRLGGDRAREALINSVLTAMMGVGLEDSVAGKAETFATLAFVAAEHLANIGRGRRLGAEAKRKRMMAIAELLRDAADRFDLVAMGDGSKVKNG